MLKRTLMSAVVLVLCAVPTPAQSAKNPEFQKIADAFVAAWNKADAKALAALHAENCITSGGDTGQLVGRAAVEQDFTKAFAATLKGTKLIVTPGNERTDQPRPRGHQRHLGNHGPHAAAPRGGHQGPLHQHLGQTGREVADRQFSSLSSTGEAVDYRGSRSVEAGTAPRATLEPCTRGHT